MLWPGLPVLSCGHLELHLTCAAMWYTQLCDTCGWLTPAAVLRMQLCALYAVTDVALVTSLRDGMNLVSYEYVACQSENAGAVAFSRGEASVQACVAWRL